MNRKNIKIIAVILTLCLLFGHLNPMITLANSNAPTITVSSVEKYAGETVDVTLTMTNNPGVVSVKLKVNYDSSVMTLTKVTDGGLLGTKYHKNTLTSPYTLSWADDIAEENITANGVIVTLTFALSDTVDTEGVYDIAVTYDNNDANIIDKDFNPVDFEIKNGSVTIKVPEKPVEGISLDKASLDMTAGDTATLTPSFTPSNATNKNVTWKSSDEKVATVKNGVVTAVAKGNATITVTTEDGAKTASCAVSVACAHTDTTKHAKVEPTCTSKGHEEYTICNQCGEVTDGEDKEIVMLPHTLTKHNPVEPTHTTAGNIQYWDCSECEQYFSDEGNTVIDKESVILAADSEAHDYTGAWNNDEESHWKDCGCGIQVSIGKHDYDNTCDTECNVCKYTRTITHTWEKTYSYDANGHWIKCSVCKVKQADPEAHKGGTATCQAKAVCDTCNQSYGTTVEHNHTAQKEEAKYLKEKATCMAEAVYYKSCTMCGEKGADTFIGSTKDANNHTGNNTVKDAVTATCYREGYTGDTYCECGAKVASGSKIGKTAHTPSTTYEKDGSNHWKVCTVAECGAKIGETAHGYDNVCDATCNTCGYTRTVTHPFDTSKWVTDGTNHWHACSTTGCTEKTDIETHKGGTATCQEQAKCSVCNKAYGTTIAHSYTAEKAEAKYLKTAATCKDVAVYYKSCTMCGAKGTDTFNGTAKDANNHVGGTELKAVVEATCTIEGYTGDTHCKGCGEKLSAGKKVAKLPHDVQGWHVSKEATVEEEGEKSGTCTGCSQVFTVKTAKLIAEIKEDKVVGNLDAEVKTDNNTTLPGESVFVAEDVTENIEKTEEKKVETAVEKAVEKVAAVTKKHEVASILDLKILIREFATNGEAIKEKEHKLDENETVTVTVQIPKTVIEKFENIILLHVKDDGTVEEVPFSYVNGDKAKFTTGGFSYYVFVGTEKVVEETPQTTPSTSPKTGDYSHATVWTIVTLVALAGVVTVITKKRRYN